MVAKQAAELAGGRMMACLAEDLGFETWVRSPIVFKIDFQQQKLSSLLITCYKKQEGAYYSVFYTEASKRHWISLND